MRVASRGELILSSFLKDLLAVLYSRRFFVENGYVVPIWDILRIHAEHRCS
jgi:hypothetical protein